MKSIQVTAEALAAHLREAMPLIADLPEPHLLANFLAEGLRYHFGAAATDLQPLSCQPDGHGGISMMPVECDRPVVGATISAQELMKRELLTKGGAATVPPSGVMAEQVGGSHYKDMPIQHAEFCQVNKLPWCESAAIKYLCRHKKKNGVQDLQKAIHYARLAAKLEYGVEL